MASEIRGRWPGSPVRVAVDGPDAAGKTTFADDLAAVLRADRDVIRLSVDGFHRPRAERLRRGPLSPEGYYLDAFDYDTIVAAVLRPLGPGGDGWYLPASFDHRADRALPPERRLAPPRAVLVFDGVFLLRDELLPHWDLTVYLHVEPAETLRRALVRDVALFGSAAVVEQRYRGRYLPGQAMYRAAAQPHRRADIVLDVTDPAAPARL